MDTSKGRATSGRVYAPIGDDDACLHWLWTTLYAPDGVSAVCKRCRTVRRFHRVSRRRAYACDHCGTQVYPTTGTFMQDSRLGVATWFVAAALAWDGEGELTPKALAEHLDISYTAALRVKRKLARAATRGGSDAALLEKLRAVESRSETDAAPARADESSSRMRERIRAAACRAFAAHGQSATRIVDIAREAGVSSAIIHYYYASKDDVLLAALQWADEQTVRRWQKLRATTGDPRRLLRQTLEMAVPEGVLHDEYLLWIEAWARVRFHPHLLAESVAMSDRWASYLTEVIDEGRQAGVFRPTVPTAELVQRLVAMSDGLAFRSAVGYPSMRAKRVNELLLAFAAEQVGVSVQDLTQPR